LENNNLTEISGEAGSGKTNFCIFLALLNALPRRVKGLEKGVLYISTVQKLPMTRVKQFISQYNLKTDEINSLFDRIHTKLCNPSEFDIFIQADIDEFIMKNDVSMIIVDSITGLADIQFINDKDEIDFIQRTIFLKK
jgi:RecA/RadA recombinase